jgi:hypothetical protein
MTIRIPRAVLIGLAVVAVLGGIVAAALLATGDEEETDCVSQLSGEPIGCDDATAVPAGSADDPAVAATTTSTAPVAPPSDEELIRGVAEEWANALATGDDRHCELESSRFEDLCKDVLASGNPSDYQAGYLNATVEEIDQSSDTKAIVTLSNGCQIEMTDEGGDDWHVSNSGGSLAKGCEQGTG